TTVPARMVVFLIALCGPGGDAGGNCGGGVAPPFRIGSFAPGNFGTAGTPPPAAPCVFVFFLNAEQPGAVANSRQTTIMQEITRTACTSSFGASMRATSDNPAHPHLPSGRQIPFLEKIRFLRNLGRLTWMRQACSPPPYNFARCRMGGQENR